MTNKPLIMIFAATLIGSLVGAAGMRYMGLLGSTTTEARAGRQDDARAGMNDHEHNEAGEPKSHVHEQEGQHKGHEHKGHDEHGEEHVVRLTAAEQREFGIEVGIADGGTLQMHVALPGEVVLNADHRAHVVPRVSGVVRQVQKTLGDQVQTGEIMAVLDSRELADMKSAYLSATERVALAAVIFRREEDLWKKQVTSEQEYLQAKQALAEARIERRAAEQKLHTLGLSDPDIARLPAYPDTTFTRYAITAPFDGTVIEKHITLGEVLKDDTTAFVVADLRSVWVDLRVYQKDLPFVRKGQAVVISAGPGIRDVQGAIAYVGPLVGEQTRTALARVVLPNLDGHWRPGLFVTGNVVVDNQNVLLLVPKTALQTIDAQPTVFLVTPEGFSPQSITLGRSNDTHIEVTDGLTPGQRYVTRGAFTLKAQLAKGTFGDGHAH